MDRWLTRSASVELLLPHSVQFLSVVQSLVRGGPGLMDERVAEQTAAVADVAPGVQLVRVPHHVRPACRAAAH